MPVHLSAFSILILKKDIFAYYVNVRAIASHGIERLLFFVVLINWYLRDAAGRGFSSVHATLYILYIVRIATYGNWFLVLCVFVEIENLCVLKWIKRRFARREHVSLSYLAPWSSGIRDMRPESILHDWYVRSGVFAFRENLHSLGRRLQSEIAPKFNVLLTWIWL